MLTVLLAMTIVSSVHAGAARLIEVTSEAGICSGKVVSMDSRLCCLQDRFGVIRRIPVSGLKSVRVLAENFVPAAASEFREKLRSEFGSDYDIAGSTHYLVCAPRGRANSYCDLFERSFRQIEHFYRVRGFEVQEPDSPLVAIIFATQDEFREYCRRDNSDWSRELLGYYSLNTNRVTLFDELSPALASTHRNVSVSPGIRSMFSIAGPTADTIIHETTHQVGYNIGVHSRIGGSPSWILEGLATVLEADGMRMAGSRSGNASRINESRLSWFRSQYSSRQQAGDLARMVADEKFFNGNVLDAYSNAWAVTWFLTENPARARAFASYLRLVESRDPLKDYSANQRLHDFREAFGDPAKVEVEMLRAMDRL
ncbi:MAG: DUF1570 domain-containing protein [Planctomycetaceae bacterium]